MRTQLNQSELETLFDLSHDLLCIANVNGFFHCVNPAFTRVLGFEEGELLDRPFIEFVHPDDRQPTLGALKELSMGKTVVSFENRYRCKNGDYKTLQWNATPDSNSELIAASARDASVEKELLLEAEKSRALRALGTVATMISHDMNNLLVPIILMSELLLETDNRNDEQCVSALKMMLTNAIRGGELTKQIQAFSTDQQAVHSAVEIENVVNEVIDGLGIRAKTKVVIGLVFAVFAAMQPSYFKSS